MGALIARLLPNARYFGLDISRRMLDQCQDNLARWGREVELFYGNAECLPYQDNSFDVVFHVGGINFFNGKEQAIREMIRVARPGAQILIADETEKHVQTSYERTPISSRYFKNRAEAIIPVVDLVPPDMQDIQQEIVWDGRFYTVSFRKPTLIADS
jgi:ubiquinone/menaquinone biosynthesis C-methylase UbiE